MEAAVEAIEGVVLGKARPGDQEQEGSGTSDGGEHRDYDADGERERKTSHLSGPKLIEDAARDQRTDVRVENGSEGALETYLDGRAERLARLSFFLHAFEDQNVCI